MTEMFLGFTDLFILSAEIFKRLLSLSALAQEFFLSLAELFCFNRQRFPFPFPCFFFFPPTLFLLMPLPPPLFPFLFLFLVPLFVCFLCLLFPFLFLFLKSMCTYLHFILLALQHLLKLTRRCGSLHFML